MEGPDGGMCVHAQLHLPSSGCTHRGSPSAVHGSPVLHGRLRGALPRAQLPRAEGAAVPGPDSLPSVLALSSPGAAAGLGSWGPEGSPGDSQDLGYV